MTDETRRRLEAPTPEQIVMLQRHADWWRMTQGGDRMADALDAVLAALPAAPPDDTRRRLEAAFLAGFQWGVNGTDRDGDYNGGPPAQGFAQFLAALTAAPPPDLVALVREFQAADTAFRAVTYATPAPEFDAAFDRDRAACRAVLAYPLAEDTAPTCQWREDEDGQWHTACGNIFSMGSEPPHDWMKFCCYCAAGVTHVHYDEMAELHAALAEDTDGGGA